MNFVCNSGGSSPVSPPPPPPQVYFVFIRQSSPTFQDLHKFLLLPPPPVNFVFIHQPLLLPHPTHQAGSLENEVMLTADCFLLFYCRLPYQPLHLKTRKIMERICSASESMTPLHHRGCILHFFEYNLTKKQVFLALND